MQEVKNTTSNGSINLPEFNKTHHLFNYLRSAVALHYGRRDALIMRNLLGEGLSLDKIAHVFGMNSRQQVRQTLQNFGGEK